MKIEYRRVRIPLRGIWADGQKGIVTIPKHAILRMIADGLDGDPEKLIPAFVGDRKLLFFAQDVKERTAAINGYAACSLADPSQIT